MPPDAEAEVPDGSVMIVNINLSNLQGVLDPGNLKSRWSSRLSCGIDIVPTQANACIGQLYVAVRVEIKVPVAQQLDYRVMSQGHRDAELISTFSR